MSWSFQFSRMEFQVYKTVGQLCGNYMLDMNELAINVKISIIQNIFFFYHFFKYVFYHFSLYILKKM